MDIAPSTDCAVITVQGVAAVNCRDSSRRKSRLSSTMRTTGTCATAGRSRGVVSNVRRSPVSGTTRTTEPGCTLLSITSVAKGCVRYFVDGTLQFTSTEFGTRTSFQKKSPALGRNLNVEALIDRRLLTCC